MPRGDHLLISDELDRWIEDNSSAPELVGHMLIALARYWRSGGLDEGNLPDCLKREARIFFGQLSEHRKVTPALSGMTAEDRREYNRRKVANSRARVRGEEEPYPDLKAGLSGNSVNAGNSGNSGNTGNTGNTGNSGNNPNQTETNQTMRVSAPAREGEGGERFAPLSREDARDIGAQVGLPAQEVDKWWDHYESLDWAPSAQSAPNARMSRNAAIATLRKWQRMRPYFDARRGGASQRPASAIRDLHQATAAEKAESERKYGF